MTNEDSISGLGKLGKAEPPEPKASPLGNIMHTKPEQKTEKPFSTPSVPEGESADFVKGYKAGYSDRQNKKNRRF
jgi:hypothetical protein